MVVGGKDDCSYHIFFLILPLFQSTIVHSVDNPVHFDHPQRLANHHLFHPDRYVETDPDEPVTDDDDEEDAASDTRPSATSSKPTRSSTRSKRQRITEPEIETDEEEEVEIDVESPPDVEVEEDEDVEIKDAEEAEKAGGAGDAAADTNGQATTDAKKADASTTQERTEAIKELKAANASAVAAKEASKQSPVEENTGETAGVGGTGVGPEADEDKL